MAARGGQTGGAPLFPPPPSRPAGHAHAKEPAVSVHSAEHKNGGRAFNLCKNCKYYELLD